MDKNHKGGLVSSLAKLEKVGAVLPLPTPNLQVRHFCTSDRDWETFRTYY